MSINVFRGFKINILFFPLLAASILGKYFLAFSAAFMCALLHELFHVFAARRTGVGISYIEVLPFGICARLRSDIIKNPAREIIIALAGPLVNIVIFAAALILRYNLSINSEILNYFILCNFYMAIVNLLPCLPLDGGRILKAYLTIKSGAVFAYNFCLKLSRLIVLWLIGGAVYLLFSSSFNLSLIIIGAFLLGNLCLEQQNISKQAIKELLFYKNKITSSEMFRASALVAHKDTPARKILKKLSYNNYHIVCVTDDDLNISKTLTEGQLINALTNRSIQITLGEI